MYRIRDGKLQVLLAHPGGPYFKNKDDGAWTIPKGELEPGEDMLEAAKREFKEETGVPPTGPFVALTPIRQKGGKVVHAWAFRGDCDPGRNCRCPNNAPGQPPNKASMCNVCSGIRRLPFAARLLSSP